jgi:kumamolisin
MSSRRRVLLGLVSALISSAALAGIALSPSSASAESRTTITVFLKAPDPAALTTLARTPIESRSARLMRLRSLAPNKAARAAAVSRLRAEGFTVLSQTTWSVTASGPSTTVSDLFGTRPTVGENPTGARYVRAIGALPRTPATLRSYVSGVYPTSAGPAPFHHASTSSLDGLDVRRADTPAGTTPSAGTHDSGATIATMQLADFNASDLTAYAAHEGVADPVASGRYRAVQVDGGPSSADDATGGDVEVDLDQESMLSTAPSARQHAYFAPNTEAGFGDAFSSVYDDVTGNQYAQLPDSHITAMSVSWGACETAMTADSIAAYQPIISSLVAAGVTIFAASGDAGIYDCQSATGTGLDNRQADVDYPASSPQVVGVGATNLKASSSAPNTGKNWTETAWSCSSPQACQDTLLGTGGTGGGASGSAYGKTSTGGTGDFGGFAAPAWQRRTITRAPFAGAKKRLVPDIAADGDPATGFVLYTSDTEATAESGSHWVQVGGTSLSAPLSAAQLTNTLGDSGRTKGVGDIHGALYSAQRATGGLASTNPHKAFRDVSVGTNGAAQDKGTDPSVKAATGYDTTSGLGGVLWKALTPYLFETDTPKPVGTLKVVKHKSSAHPTVAARWHTDQADDAIVVDTTRVTLSRVGSSAVIATRSARSGHVRFTGVKRGSYRLVMTAVDIAGHRSAAKVVRLKVS